MHYCTYTHIHTCTYAYTYTCTHTHIDIYIYIYPHTHMHTYIHAYLHTCMHTYVHTHIHTCIPRVADIPDPCRHKHTSIYACTPSCIKTYLPPYMYVSTYIATAHVFRTFITSLDAWSRAQSFGSTRTSSCGQLLADLRLRADVGCLRPQALNAIGLLTRSPALNPKPNTANFLQLQQNLA